MREQSSQFIQRQGLAILLCRARARRVTVFKIDARAQLQCLQKLYLFLLDARVMLLGVHDGVFDARTPSWTIWLLRRSSDMSATVLNFPAMRLAHIAD